MPAADRHILNNIRPGQPITAEIINLIKVLASREVTGPDVIQTASGWHVRGRNKKAGAGANVCIITGITPGEDRYVGRRVDAELLPLDEEDVFFNCFKTPSADQPILAYLPRPKLVDVRVNANGDLLPFEFPEDAPGLMPYWEMTLEGSAPTGTPQNLWLCPVFIETCR